MAIVQNCRAIEIKATNDATLVGIHAVNELILLALPEEFGTLIFGSDIHSGDHRIARHVDQPRVLFDDLQDEGLELDLCVFVSHTMKEHIEISVVVQMKAAQCLVNSAACDRHTSRSHHQDALHEQKALAKSLNRCRFIEIDRVARANLQNFRRFDYGTARCDDKSLYSNHVFQRDEGPLLVLSTNRVMCEKSRNHGSINLRGLGSKQLDWLGSHDICRQLANKLVDALDSFVHFLSILHSKI